MFTHHSPFLTNTKAQIERFSSLAIVLLNQVSLNIHPFSPISCRYWGGGVAAQFFYLTKGVLSSGTLILRDYHSREGTSTPNGCKGTDWGGSYFNLRYLIGINFLLNSSSHSGNNFDNKVIRKPTRHKMWCGFSYSFVTGYKKEFD